MKAEITKIHLPKIGASGKSYIRVEFRLLETDEWAKTDLVPAFRNFKRWKPILDRGVGTFVTGLKVDGVQVDADSLVNILELT